MKSGGNYGQDEGAWALPELPDNGETQVSVGVESGVENGNVSLMVRTESSAMMVILPRGVANALWRELKRRLSV